MTDPAWLPPAESLTVEFKSNRKRLPDDDLVGAVVAMANTSGGSIYIGVEDDGTVTGLDPKHDPPDGIVPLVANRTVPSVVVTVERLARGLPRLTCPEHPRSWRLPEASSCAGG
ncbi:MAG: ATP-binding protein [Polyangiaceae bacterium]|nr:ATP-binding protein [Polyangiaceae bacterium]